MSEPSERETMGDLLAIMYHAEIACFCNPTWRALHKSKRLHPKRWEALRLELQKTWREATGEEFAVLEVKP